MKSNRISFFNRLEDTDLLRKIKFSATPYEASYEFKDQKVELSLKPDDYDLRKFNVSDEKALWNISKDGLFLRRTIQIKHPELLFDDSGITDRNSILGIAAVCVSTESDRLEVFGICELNSENDAVNMPFKFELSPGKYRGNVIIKTILYLVENNEEQSRFPKQSGTVLGSLDEFHMILSDDRQLFPVYEVSEPDSPLWWAVCNWSDIEEDAFVSENIAVVFNNSHPMYKYIEYTSVNKDFNKGYLAEIMSSAIQVIIEKMKESVEEWDRIVSNATFREGTIAFMIKYMKDTFEWDLSSPELTAKTVRAHIYSRMMLK